MKKVTDTSGTPQKSVDRGTRAPSGAFVNENGTEESQVGIGTGHSLTEPPSQKWIAILAD